MLDRRRVKEGWSEGRREKGDSGGRRVVEEVWRRRTVEEGWAGEELLLLDRGFDGPGREGVLRGGESRLEGDSKGVGRLGGMLEGDNRVGREASVVVGCWRARESAQGGEGVRAR